MMFFLQRPRTNRSSWNISSPSDIDESDTVNVCELVDILLRWPMSYKGRVLEEDLFRNKLKSAPVKIIIRTCGHCVRTAYTCVHWSQLSQELALLRAVTPTLQCLHMYVGLSNVCSAPLGLGYGSHHRFG